MDGCLGTLPALQHANSKTDVRRAQTFTLLLLGKATPTPDPAAPSSLLTVLQ